MSCNDYPLLWPKDASEAERRAELEREVRALPTTPPPWRRSRRARSRCPRRPSTSTASPAPRPSSLYEPPASPGEQPTKAPVLVVSGRARRRHLALRRAAGRRRVPQLSPLRRPGRRPRRRPLRRELSPRRAHPPLPAARARSQRLIATRRAGSCPLRRMFGGCEHKPGEAPGGLAAVEARAGDPGRRPGRSGSDRGPAGGLRRGSEPAPRGGVVVVGAPDWPDWRAPTGCIRPASRRRSTRREPIASGVDAGPRASSPRARSASTAGSSSTPTTRGCAPSFASSGCGSRIESPGQGGARPPTRGSISTARCAIGISSIETSGP